MTQTKRSTSLAGSAVAGGDSAAVRIGIRLRHARLTKGMRLHDLADRAGCSESFLSKVENDRQLPSLATLHRIVAALETNVSALFADADDGQPVSVLRSGNRPMIRTDPEWQGKGVVLERLLPNRKGVLLQANIHHVAPHSSSHGLIEHEGEELGFVLDGSIELSVNNVVYRLGAGDSFFFASHLLHGYRNPEDRPARILWVNTPPSF
jgi:transcriptional regulator with XRE-family HTH domain